MEELLKTFDKAFGDYGTYSENNLDALQQEVNLRLNIKLFIFTHFLSKSEMLTWLEGEKSIVANIEDAVWNKAIDKFINKIKR